MENTTAESSSSIKLFTRDEVSMKSDDNATWIIIHNNVYDVRKFLQEHPGGAEVLLEQEGKDGTEAFEDVGHSSDARQMMEPFKIGEIVPEERDVSRKEDKKRDWMSGAGEDDGTSGSWRSWLIPIALGVLATLVYRYFIGAR